MKSAILGFGREGKSLLKFLKKRGEKPVILDQKLNSNYLKRLDEFDVVYRSPGVPYNLPQIQKALKSGIKFSSSTKLFFDLCPCPIIGVTGTKGKGTTSTLIYQILKNSLPAGRQAAKVFLAGNIGKPALEILSKLDKKSVAVLELSSFQLQDLEKSPHLAVVLDMFPDHLDAHENMKEYIEAKANIAKFQKRSDAIFYFKDNRLSKAVAAKSGGVKIGFDGGPLGLKKNFLMAANVAAYLGCPEAKIFKTLENFQGLEHRLEFVAEKGGVKFYNDSASTNPQTAATAISSFNEPVVLIAGGKDKNLDYKPLAEAIKKSGNVKKIFLFGENKRRIKKALQAGELCKDLKEAVRLAVNSRAQVVLFSPASASFDMFQDYADRGRKFKKIISLIPKKGGIPA